MAELICLGGDVRAENFFPAQIPTEIDTLITTHNTGDLYFDQNTKFASIDVSEFEGDIYYQDKENRIQECYLNSELDEFFSDQNQFIRA